MPAAPMIDDPVLLNDWHVVARESDLAPGSVTSARLLGLDHVVWRGDSEIHVWDDLCIHRGAKSFRRAGEERLHHLPLPRMDL